jgi:hypothetical protein
LRSSERNGKKPSFEPSPVPWDAWQTGTKRLESSAESRKSALQMKLRESRRRGHLAREAFTAFV